MAPAAATAKDALALGGGHGHEASKLVFHVASLFRLIKLILKAHLARGWGDAIIVAEVQLSLTQHDDEGGIVAYFLGQTRQRIQWRARR